MKSNRIKEYPPILEDLGTGRSYYNFNVVEEDTEGVRSYDYDQVAVDNPVTGEKIIQALTDAGYYVTGKKRELKNMVEADCETLEITGP